jgi:hypothetical protein
MFLTTLLFEVFDVAEVERYVATGVISAAKSPSLPRPDLFIVTGEDGAHFILAFLGNALG